VVPLARCPDKRWLATETVDIFLLRNSLQFEEGRRDLIWTVPKPVGIKEPRIVKINFKSLRGIDRPTGHTMHIDRLV